MRKAIFIIFIVNLIFSYIISTAIADDPQAVESVGEINSKGNSTGTILAGMKADLILTVIADMSQAEPGEEIESIQISLPGGFGASNGAVTAVRTSENEIPNFEEVVDGNRIIVVLPKLITLSTVLTIEFTVDAPATPVGLKYIMVSLLNILKSPIIVAVKPGNADGRVNNDDFMVNTVPATKPDPPSNLEAQAATDGENDIILSWTKSEDEAVSGYFIYRSDKGDVPVADIINREQEDHVDRNLVPGESYTYTIRSYKTQALRSDASKSAIAIAPPDTEAPEAPAVTPEVTATDKGIEIFWQPSISKDVVKYIVYRGGSLESREPIGELPPDAVSYMDKNPPESGSYLYIVVAVDDVGTESTPSATQLRQVLSGIDPQPNPFTPLSADSRYNQIAFPAAMVEEGEGSFSIKVFDLDGDLVFELEADENSKEIMWDGKDTNGEYVKSGIYVYQATKGSEYQIGSIVVAK